MLPTTFAVYLSDPILSNGGVSADWVMVIMAAIVGFFFVRTLVSIEFRIKTLTTQMSSVITEQSRLRQEFNFTQSDKYIDGQNAKLAEIIIAKIKAMTP